MIAHSPSSSPLKTFYHEHKLAFFALLGGLLLIIALIIVIIIANADYNDGVIGDSSKEYDTSVSDDQKALQDTESFKISKYLPIISADPSYKISYQLSRDEEEKYHFSLLLTAFSASAREPMIKRLLSEKFGTYDPLDYKIEITNYYNPFTDYSLDDLISGNLPSNMTKTNSYSFENSPYSVQVITHTLYDGAINTYRYVLKDGEPITMPSLLFTYQDLSFLSKEAVKTLNSLE